MTKRNYFCKLTIEQEQQVIQEYLSGKSARNLAKDYGFSSHGGITRILKCYGIEQRDAPTRNRLYSVNASTFDVIDTEHKAYWYGFLYADGCVHKRTLTLALKWNDREHIEKFKSFMESESPIHRTIKRTGKSKCDNAQIEMTDRNMANRLKALGIIPRRIAFDRVLANLPDNLIQHWIRGFYDGDGSAGIHSVISFVGQIPLLTFIREQLSKNCGTNPLLSIHKHTISDIYYLVISGRIQATKVASYLYKDCSVCLTRKRIVVNSWKAPESRQRNEKGQYV